MTHRPTSMKYPRRRRTRRGGGGIDAHSVDLSPPNHVSCSRSLPREVFIEAYPIAERVDDLHAFRPVEGLFDTRPQVAVTLGGDFAVKLVQAGHADVDGRTRTAIAVVFGQM